MVAEIESTEAFEKSSNYRGDRDMTRDITGPTIQVLLISPRLLYRSSSRVTFGGRKSHLTCIVRKIEFHEQHGSTGRLSIASSMRTRYAGNNRLRDARLQRALRHATRQKPVWEFRDLPDMEGEIQVIDSLIRPKL